MAKTQHLPPQNKSPEIESSTAQNQAAHFESSGESSGESARIQALLAGESPQARVHFFPHLDSTQDKALQLAKQGAAHGTLVIAGEQSAGRGRHQRTWWHDAKNGLAFTLIVRSDLAARAVPGLVFVAALALREAIAEEGIEARIKWPNDLVAEVEGQPRKLAGILSQASLRGDQLNYALIGVGLNVNTAPEDFANAAGQAGSLFSISHKKHNKYKILAHFCKRFQSLTQTLVEQGLAPLLDPLRACSATLGERVWVQIEGRKEQALALDFNADGALIVRLDSGAQREIFDPLE